MKSHSQPPGFLANYVSYYKSHPLLKEDTNARQINAYFDEVQVWLSCWGSQVRYICLIF